MTDDSTAPAEGDAVAETNTPDVDAPAPTPAPAAPPPPADPAPEPMPGAVAPRFTGPDHVTSVTLSTGRVLTVVDGVLAAPDDLTPDERASLHLNGFTAA